MEQTMVVLGQFHCIFSMAFRSDPFLLGIIHLSIYGNAACANKNPGTHLDPTTPSYDFIHPLGPAPHNGTCSPSAGKSSGKFWEKKGKLKKAWKKSEVLALSRLQTFGATPQVVSFVSTESKLASPNKKYCVLNWHRVNLFEWTWLTSFSWFLDEEVCQMP